MSPDAFDRFVTRTDPAMVVVTVRHDGERSGCLVGFHTQASIEPRRYLVYVSRANHTHRLAMAADRVGVHLLTADQLDLARLFGERTGDEVDKFARCRWAPGPDDVPILTDAAAWFVGRVVDRVPGGDHDGLLLEPVGADADDDGRPALRLHDAAGLHPGHPA